MARYIDADAWNEFYIERTKDLESYNHYDMGYGDAMDNVDDWMDAQPTIEARPVVRGEWIKYKLGWDDYVLRVKCSVCDHREYNNKPHFCPNCGADMRTEKENERLL